MTGRPLDTAEDWAAYRALPEWEVTVQFTRTARFRVHAATAGEARSRVEDGENGVRSLSDLYSPDDLELDHVISVEAVSP